LLTAVPKQLLSWSYIVHDESRELARIELAWLRAAGTLVLAGKTYRLERRGLVSGTYALDEGDTVLASARPSGFLLRTLEVDAGRDHYTLQPAGMWSRAFVLTKGKQELGTIRPMGLFSRQALVDVPESVPQTLQLFLLWLVLVRWKRQAAQ
jgi:hypothetical protein